MNEQAAPLPILILAAIFIAVWNMEPFVVEEDNVSTRATVSLDSAPDYREFSSEKDLPDARNRDVNPESKPFVHSSTNQVQKLH